MSIGDVAACLYIVCVYCVPSREVGRLVIMSIGDVAAYLICVVYCVPSREVGRLW